MLRVGMHSGEIVGSRSYALRGNAYYFVSGYKLLNAACIFIALFKNKYAAPFELCCYMHFHAERRNEHIKYL